MGYGDGRIFQPKKRDGTPRGSRWWIAYYVNGREVRETAATEREAGKLLRRRLAARDAGLVVVPEETRLTITGMLDSYEAHLTEQQKKSATTVHSHLKPIRAAFGDRKALSLTAADFKVYRAGREAAGKARSTTDHELGALRAAFQLAKRQDRLSRVPFIPMYGKSADVVRQGFVEHEQFEAVVSHLPDVLADVARFAHLSAWRRGEVVPLRWTQVDRRAREVRLVTSKSGHPRTLPLEGELWQLIERRWQARQFETPDGTAALSPLVFHDGGRPIGDFRKAWATACSAAGVPGLRFHDLRRSGIRNLIRAGVPQSVTMALSGHRTVSTFIRYDIASDEDKREALRAVADHVSKAACSNVVQLKHGANTEPRVSGAE